MPRYIASALSAKDPAYVHEAAKRGVFAYIVDSTPEDLQSAIDITLQRFTEYHSLQDGFGHRAHWLSCRSLIPSCAPRLDNPAKR
jgi:AmiR/NasT family two-component response regulator